MTSSKLANSSFSLPAIMCIQRKRLFDRYVDVHSAALQVIERYIQSGSLDLPILQLPVPTGHKLLALSWIIVAPSEKRSQSEVDVLVMGEIWDQALPCHHLCHYMCSLFEVGRVVVMHLLLAIEGRVLHVRVKALIHQLMFCV